MTERLIPDSRPTRHREYVERKLLAILGYRWHHQGTPTRARLRSPARRQALVSLLLLMGMLGFLPGSSAQQPRSLPGDAKPAEAAPVPDSPRPIVVYVQPPTAPVATPAGPAGAPIMVTPVDHAMSFLIALGAALPALLAAIAAFIQSMRNGTAAADNKVKIDAIHAAVVSNQPPRQANT
jgi:hypothetical protein